MTLQMLFPRPDIDVNFIFDLITLTFQSSRVFPELLFHFVDERLHFSGKKLFQAIENLDTFQDFLDCVAHPSRSATLATDQK